MKKTLAGAAALATVAALTLVVAPTAQAAAGDGTITVTVAEDRNANSTRDYADTVLSGVTVRFTDAENHTFTRTTDASGQVVLSAADAGNTLVGGKYRVEVTNPNTGRYSEVRILDGHAEPQYTPATSFVDVSDGAAATISVGYVDVDTLGPEGARVFSAVQPDDIWPGSETTEVYSIPYSLSPATVTDLTSRNTIGAVYGIGLDTEKHEIYAGAYAKRGSTYGPEGPGGLYRVNAYTGAWEVYAVVADAGTTEHSTTMSAVGDRLQDFDFRSAVGREALGDVEVNDANTFVTAVNMNTDSLVVYPVQDATPAAPVQTLPVAPIDCAADWAPSALEEDGDLLHVGAVCGATLDTYVITYQRAADGTLSPTGAVLHANVDVMPDRDSKTNTVFSLAGAACSRVEWRAWSDDVDQNCIDGSSYSTPVDQGNVGNQWTFPQPILADIELLDDGQMILSFRDRGSDQYGSPLYFGTKTNGQDSYGSYIATGDIVAVEVSGTELLLDEPYEFGTVGAFHNEAASAGIVHVPGTDTVLSNQMDATGAILTNGLRLFNLSNGTARANATVTDDFGKSQGLADMEALVLDATQQIGNRIWIDADQDGLQDPGERVAAGVQVSLYDEEGVLVATTETDENGEYWFDTNDGLLPETNYQIRVDRASDFEPNGPLVGMTLTSTATGGNRGIDNNGSTATVGGVPTVVANVRTPEIGRNDHSIDFGFVPSPVSIGDYVWIDADNDGQQDAGEAPVSGITVRLLDADGNEIDSTTTDANGYYAFTDLNPETDYTVVFPTTVTVDGNAYRLTAPTRGAGASDSNPAADTGLAPVRTPEFGENSGEPGEADDPTIDAGYVPIVSVGDYVWVDADKDGVQDEGESPIPGVTVNLLSADGETVIATTTTDENGYYVFTDLPGGTDFIIEFPTTVTIDGTDYPLTDPNQGGDDEADSDAAPSTGRVEITTPASGSNSAEPGEADDPSIDAGYVVPPVSIGDYVWLDADRDGLQDEGESPVDGALITLLAPDGVTVVATTTTDENGYYAFTDLTPGTDYIVKFPTQVTVDGVRYVLTQPTQGGEGDDVRDSNPATDTGLASVTTPLNGENSGEPGEADDPTIDAGYVPVLVSVGDYVWLDADADGIQDDDESPIPGITVTLLDENGDVVKTTTTDENGYYVFTDLINSTDYIIEFPTTVTVDGVTRPLTVPGVGDSNSVDSNPEVTTGRAPVTTPADGQNSAEPGEADDPTIDAGYAVLVSAGDYVWIDSDHDGVQDPNEKPVAGVDVKLYDADGELVATTKTDDTGFFVFTDLKPSTQYTIEFPTSVEIGGVTYPLTKPNVGGDASDSDADPTTGRITFVTPATGNNSALPGEADLPTLDAGYDPPAAGLATTGGAFPWVLGGGAAALLLLGAALVLIRRRSLAGATTND